MYHDAEKAEVFNKYLCSASAGKQEQKKKPLRTKQMDRYWILY